MGTIISNLQAVRACIAKAVAAAGRAPGAVQLLAVSKMHPPEAIEQAWQAGQHAFGENYVQEALDKMARLAPRPIEWHLIGPLQGNKTRLAAQHFAWVHSLARESTARRLATQRPAGLAPLNVLLQVNVSAEETKSGVAPHELAALARAVATLPRLRLRGLMAIPAPSSDPVQQRASFAKVRVLYAALRADGHAIDTLSLGMSEDFAAAIAEGSTLVRIGSAIFGVRQRERSAA